MTQLSQMFQESNKRMKRLMDSLESGMKPDLETINSAQREFEGQIKAISAIVSMYAVMSKNKRAISGLDKMNIMDDSTAIDLMIGDPNDDKVKCPVYERLITRAECLDTSGDPSTNEECQGCEIGIATKRKLLSV